MLAFLLWLLLGLLALILSILATPILIRIDAQSGPQPSLRVALRLLGGLTPAIVLTDSARAGRKTRQGPKKPAVRADRETQDKARPTERSGKGRRSRINGRMIGALPQLIGDVVGRIHFDDLDLEGEFGLGDPAATGHAFGAMTPVLYGLSPSERISLDLRPNFDRAVLLGRIGTLIRITPLAFLPPALRFGWVAFGPAR